MFSSGLLFSQSPVGLGELADLSRKLFVDRVRAHAPLPVAAQNAGGVDAAVLAQLQDVLHLHDKELGGGGHAQAAGCTIHTSLMEAFNQMLLEMKKKIEK